MIHLMAIGETQPPVLEGLRRGLSQELGEHCEILPERFTATAALNLARQQLNSTEILSRLPAAQSPGAKLVGVACEDLFIPVLTFVFGEAQMSGPCAVVSTFRLRQEFYGLPADDELLEQRLLKETLHELGHTFGLRHCDDYGCVMAASHSVEWIDLKSHAFCEQCRMRFAAANGAKHR